MYHLWLDSESDEEEESEENAPNTQCIKLNLQPPIENVYFESIEKRENFDFGNALANVYPVLDIIFEYLDICDLKQCSDVCNSWKFSATKALSTRALYPRIIQSRKEIGYKLQELYSTIPRKNILPSFSILFFLYKKIKLDYMMCVHNSSNSDSECASERVSLKQFTEEYVFPDSDILALGCRCFSSTFKGSEEVNDQLYFEGLEMPQIPGIRNVFFRYQPKVDYAEKVIDDAIKTNEEIKCLMIFNTNYFAKTVNGLMGALKTKQNLSNLALGGGTVIGGINTFSPNMRRQVTYKNDLFCIGFLKNIDDEVDFDAYSFVIKNKKNDNGEDLKQYFNKLKYSAVLRKFGIAIRIFCISKMCPELEVELFKKYFPNYPLIGFGGDGEIGLNNFGDIIKDEPAKKKHRKQNAFTHLGASSFVLLTWGPKITAS